MTLASLHQQGWSMRCMAELLGRSPSTNSRELRRNACAGSYASVPTQSMCQQRQLAERLGASAVTVRRGDGVALLAQQAGAGLDLVLLDPPFDAQALFVPALQAAARATAAHGFIYLEAPRRWTAQQLTPLGLTCRRYLKAGASHAHLLAPQPASPAGPGDS